MKFFALVALALVATSDASTVAAVTATRSTSLVAGAAGGNLVLSVTASNAGNIAASGTITAVVDGNIFSADGDTACTATAEDASGTAVTTAPTFVSTLTGTAANKGVVTNQGTGTETITFTMGALNTDILADDHKIIITCTGNLATNAATATTYTFSVTTSGDTTAATGAYTLKTTPVRGSAATALMVGQAGGDLVLKFTPTTQIAAGGTATFTASEAIFTAGGNSAATTCTTAVATGTAPTSTTTSATSASVLVVTFVGQALATNVEATITCTANLADNGATAQAVTFGLVTSADLNALATQTGYTLTAKKVTAFTAARATSLVTGVAGGDLTFTFTPTTAIAATGTATITASEALYTAVDATTTCATTVTGGGTAPTSTTTVASSGTGVTGNNVLVLTFVGNGVNAGSVATVVCSANLAVNGAAGAVTFGIKTDAADGTALDSEATAQTGYTITAATSAASSTASVSMLTMLALAAVAMRQ